ncbi:MAG: MFS transporter [Proteobacteria bacterium]|nr:MFS transporter [Pseudomonadota bacterium]
MREVCEHELDIGTVLAWPVFDRAGKLLLGEGMVVACQAQLDMLLSRGHVDLPPPPPMMPPLQSQAPSPPRSAAALPAASTAPQNRTHLLLRTRPTTPKPPPVFDSVLALKLELHCIHEALMAVASRELGEQVLDLADRLRALVARDADAALAAMQLDASDDSHIPRLLHAAILCQLAAQAQRLDEAQSRSLVAAALTFDLALGPIADALNRQTTELTSEQRERIEAHPADGVVLLEAGGVSDPLWLDAVLHHHERLDGSGYPQGLAGEAISREARTLAIVDTFQNYAFIVLIPEISRSLGIGLGTIALLLVVRTLSISLSPLPIAALVQRHPRRAMLVLAGASLWAATTLYTGFATALWMLVVILILDGLSSGTTQALHQPLLMDSYPPPARVRVFSIYRSFDYFGNILAPLLVGVTGMRSIAVTMEPVSSLRAHREVEHAVLKGLADEELRARAGFTSTARRRRAQETAARREQELADGHADYRLAGYVTVTAGSLDQLEAACGEVEQAAQQCSLELRRLDGEQDVAFTWTLPLARGLK